MINDIMNRDADYQAKTFDKLASKAFGKAQFMQKRHNTVSMMARPYLFMYSHFLRLQWCELGMSGPINMYAPWYLLLFLRFAAFKHGEVRWDMVIRDWSFDAIGDLDAPLQDDDAYFEYHYDWLERQRWGQELEDNMAAFRTMFEDAYWSD